MEYNGLNNLCGASGNLSPLGNIAVTVEDAVHTLCNGGTGNELNIVALGIDLYGSADHYGLCNVGKEGNDFTVSVCDCILNAVVEYITYGCNGIAERSVAVVAEACILGKSLCVLCAEHVCDSTGVIGAVLLNGDVIDAGGSISTSTGCSVVITELADVVVLSGCADTYYGRSGGLTDKLTVDINESGYSISGGGSARILGGNDFGNDCNVYPLAGSVIVVCNLAAVEGVVVLSGACIVADAELSLSGVAVSVAPSALGGVKLAVSVVKIHACRGMHGLGHHLELENGVCSLSQRVLSRNGVIGVLLIIAGNRLESEVVVVVVLIYAEAVFTATLCGTAKGLAVVVVDLLGSGFGALRQSSYPSCLVIEAGLLHRVGGLRCLGADVGAVTCVNGGNIDELEALVCKISVAEISDGSVDIGSCTESYAQGQTRLRRMLRLYVKAGGVAVACLLKVAVVEVNELVTSYEVVVISNTAGVDLTDCDVTAVEGNGGLSVMNRAVLLIVDTDD